ncbi:tRNA 2-thiouridine(34) synthase MnmA [bacterium]|nr:tRNA 2-thiouridine(34) synthase MnmA [bacterium]MBU1752643.1 tRNA 2-thiouridine(34) synthase MnmA [bacterium]
MAKRIVAAMSGGVDSSVTAYLLKKAGYEVIGITMDTGTEGRHRDLHLQEAGYEVAGITMDIPVMGCQIEGTDTCPSQVIEDARDVAGKLGIEHHIIDCRAEFEQKIISYFIDEYLRGCTPNPCVVCNSKIKFGLLLDRARQLGAEYLATGHYARIEQQDARFVIRKGIDLTKDQSYFLYRLTQEQLSQAIMPLGNYQKADVRKIATRLGLKTADKPESQEICFIPQNNYQEFIRQRALDRLVPGDILNSDGIIIGRHEGIAFYTIGQRRGLRIAAGKPLYVISIDPNKNAIIVGDKDLLYCKRLTAKAMNWVSVSGITSGIELMARIRYLHKEVRAFVSPLNNDMVSVEFYEPQQAITPGQSVVFYENENVVGGGIIGGN